MAIPPPHTQELLDRLAAGETLQADEVDLDDGPFVADTLGLVWDTFSADRVTAHLDVTERHHQPYGLVHGGVWCAVVETMASVAGAMRAAPDGQIVVGVVNSTDFLRPHREGRVDAVATPLQVGRRQQLWQVVLTRAEDGKAVARGQVRLQNLDPSQLG